MAGFLIRGKGLTRNNNYSNSIASNLLFKFNHYSMRSHAKEIIQFLRDINYMDLRRNCGKIRTTSTWTNNAHSIS